MKNIGDYINDLSQQKDISQNFKRLMKQVYEDQEVREFLEDHKDRLDHTAIARSSSQLYEFVSEKEKFRNNEKGLMPGYYPELVVHNNRIEVEYVPSTAEIKRQKEQEIKNRIKSFHMPKELHGASLENLDVSDQRREIILKIQEILQQFYEHPNQFFKGLYIHGAYGIGKTFILGALAHEFSKQETQVALVHFQSFVDELKGAIHNNSVNEKVDQIKKYPILMIDDIGAESVTSWTRDSILGVILQYRMQEQLPTFFSSNMNMKDLEKHLTTSQKGDEEPMKASRIMERIKYLSEEIELKGNNRRY